MQVARAYLAHIGMLVNRVVRVFGSQTVDLGLISGRVVQNI